MYPTCSSTVCKENAGRTRVNLIVNRPVLTRHFRKVSSDFTFLLGYMSTSLQLMYCFPLHTPGAFPEGIGGRYVRLTSLPSSCAVVVNSWNINFLEPSGPVTGLLYLYLFPQPTVSFIYFLPQHVYPTCSSTVCKENAGRTRVNLIVHRPVLSRHFRKVSSDFTTILVDYVYLASLDLVFSTADVKISLSLRVSWQIG